MKTYLLVFICFLFAFLAGKFNTHTYTHILVTVGLEYNYKFALSSELSIPAVPSVA